MYSKALNQMHRVRFYSFQEWALCGSEMEIFQFMSRYVGLLDDWIFVD